MCVVAGTASDDQARPDLGHATGQRGLGGGRDKATVMEMDGRSIETIRNSRASECGVRGLWTAYRALMGV